MPLTPLDIHNKEFSNKFRGYDEDEVNEFLDQVVKDYEIVIREKKSLEEHVQQLEEKLGHFTNIEETLNKSILVAQETAEEVRGNAMKESKLIIKEAEKNADRIINEALSKSRRISMDVEELKKQYSTPGFMLNIPYEDDLLMPIITFGIFKEIFDLPNLR